MKPPPRIWWDGADLWVLAPPPYVDSRGRSTLPGRYRLESADDVPDSMVELVPVQPVPGLDDEPADRVIASVVLVPQKRRPLWLRRLRCFTLGHSPVGVEVPASEGSGWPFLVCRTCDRRVAP